MIQTSETLATLRPWLGSAFLARHQTLAERITAKINAFSFARDSVADMAQWMDDLLFFTVRDETAGKMAVMVDSGATFRVRVEDFDGMTDDVLYLLFALHRGEEDAFRAVRAYSVKAGSLAALKALYLDFVSFQTPGEWETVRRVITACHAPYRWRQWI